MDSDIWRQWWHGHAETPHEYIRRVQPQLVALRGIPANERPDYIQQAIDLLSKELRFARKVAYTPRERAVGE
jgi:hypothetical protein